MTNVAINGLGRIGRAALKILLDAEGLRLVAVNDLADVDNLAYLLEFDTVYGRYHREVTAAEGAFVVDGRRVTALAERDPANLPWDDLDVDLVLECTGVFATAGDLAKHVEAGASYVILSAPTKSESVPPVVHGVPTSTGAARATTRAVPELAGRFDGWQFAPPSRWARSRTSCSSPVARPRPSGSTTRSAERPPRSGLSAVRLPSRVADQVRDRAPR